MSGLWQKAKRKLKISEGRIIAKAFHIIQEKGLWRGDKFKCYENSSSLIYIKKHGVAYKSGNNHCVDFYVKDGKVGWEVIRRFDVNQADLFRNGRKAAAKLSGLFNKGICWNWIRRMSGRGIRIKPAVWPG